MLLRRTMYVQHPTSGPSGLREVQLCIGSILHPVEQHFYSFLDVQENDLKINAENPVYGIQLHKNIQQRQLPVSISGTTFSFLSLHVI